MIQLKNKADVERHRKIGLARQKYVCPICRGSLAFGASPALDHSHKNGQTRSVLCNSCNVGEGKVLAGLKFRTPLGNLALTDSIQWLKNLIKYLEYHEAHPSGVYHPTFDVKKGRQKPVPRKKK